MADYVKVTVISDTDALGEELDKIAEEAVRVTAERVAEALKGTSGSSRLEAAIVVEPVERTGPHQFTAQVVADDEIAYRIFIAKTQGTGIYAGHTSYVITHKSRLSLKFQIDDQDVFADNVTILGIQPDAVYAARVEDIMNDASDDLEAQIIDGIGNLSTSGATQ